MKKKFLDFSSFKKKKSKMNKGEFTVDLLREVFNDIFNKEPPPKTRTPSVTKCEWLDEEENLCWSWKIDTGSSIMYCNDAGKEMFDKALKDDLYGE